MSDEIGFGFFIGFIVTAFFILLVSLAYGKGESSIAESCANNGVFIIADDVYQCRLVRPAQQGGVL